MEMYKKYSYREIAGKLLFLVTMTRPDIAFTVNTLARRQINPEEKDWRRIKRVLHYLRSTASWELEYGGRGEGWECFVDADFAADREDKKSTTGFCHKSIWGRSVLVE